MKKNLLFSVLGLMAIIAAFTYLHPKTEPARAATSWYVSPTGLSSNAGTMNSPWDLATALNSNWKGVQGGDTIWLRGGTYNGNFTSNLVGSPGNPIIVRQYPGERATLDNGMTPHNGDNLYVTGSDTWYWGFEITNSDGNRWDGGRATAVEIVGPRNKFINTVVHDGLQGFGFWSTSQPSDSELYGNIIYNVGIDASDRGHGHSIYVQNTSGIKKITDNIMFNGMSFGVHAYTEGGRIDNIQLEGNVSFNHGILSSVSGTKANYLYWGPAAVNPVMKDNMGYMSDFGNGGARNIDVRGCSNGTFTGNYMSGGTAASLQSCSGTITGNSLFGGVDGVPGSGNTISGSKPTGLKVFVRPNAYETGRANIIVYNWNLQSTVPVDLSSSGLKNGDTFTIRDAQNFYGAPAVTGTYNGGTVSIPMTGLTTAQPIGNVAVHPPHTAPEFGVFVVLPGNTTYVVPPPPAAPGTATLTYLGKTRDLVGRTTTALGADGSQDSVFMVQISGMVGTKTISQIELRNPNNGAYWNTVASANNWPLGVTATSSGPLVNAANKSVSFQVADGNTFYVLSDDDSQYLNIGSTVKLSINYTDGTFANQTITLSTPTNPTPTPTPSPTPPPSTSNQLPIGNLDGTKNNGTTIYGWMYDPDSSSSSGTVHLYINGPAGTGQLLSGVPANIFRPDVNSAKGISGNHGFEFNIPNQYMDGNPHTVYAYGIDLSDSTKSVILPGSPITFTLTALSCGSTIPTNSFQACYYDNIDFTGLKLVTNESAINYEYVTASPYPEIGADTFSVLWRGNFTFEAANYTFTSTTDDGMRVSVDNTVIIDKMFDQAPANYTATVPMTAGSHQVKVEYYENEGGATAKASWVKVTNPAPPSPAPSLVGDLNNDCLVNTIDFSLMNAKWQTADSVADLNHDGIVNTIDFSLMNANWFKTC